MSKGVNGHTRPQLILIEYMKRDPKKLYSYEELLGQIGIKPTPESWAKDLLRLAQIVSRMRTSLYREYRIMSERNKGYRLVDWQES
jgi:hypothetical protein